MDPAENMQGMKLNDPLLSHVELQLLHEVQGIKKDPSWISLCTLMHTIM
jgi:hypothetical protein